ncbi:MAG: hypothetical protein FJZ78_08795 [Bacteroidetes bacterium]|nr:hypothetical protein [Bacteroidota bacterium]
MPSFSISPDLSKWLEHHAGDDPIKVRLAGKEVEGYTAAFVADQLTARQRFKRKFPKICADPFFVFPPSVHLEQASSETTARIKLELILDHPSPRNHIIDLTAGFGVDALSFSEIFRQVSLVEPDPYLHDLTQANFIRTAPTKFSLHLQTAEDFLLNKNLHADWIFVDPSRRDEGQRKFLLEDSFPNVVALHRRLLEVAPQLLIKTSPMLDISACLKSLPGITGVHIVSVDNECKEVLYHIDSTKKMDEPEIRCINIRNNGTRELFNFFPAEELNRIEVAVLPDQYLMEPNASVMKSGGFNSLCRKFGLMPVGNSTRLFTSTTAPFNFPGKIFKVNRPFTKSDEGMAAAVISRNHPLSADQIRKKYSLKESDKTFLIAFTGRSEKYLLLADRL